ncbi:zinc finger CCCH domain-containing protein 13 isoform X2 [Olea europaea var. sylvestris]|uniref:zinc finger CCCH domain-containing protein 13 isoform X2 n=1 Tax=Olea europaea var. sylvestris TaxID=158386 RepID=UPI000C1CF7BB|nr:zinc finger CCCH domain-containing protein 13 isoform X2 [Olea europaea var. sylvestris]
MVEKKLFKTKLCQLYQKGRCNRQYCNYAHGEAELRRSFNGRQDYRGRDLRERLDRRHSPLRRYSLERDSRARHVSHGGSPHSLGKRTDGRARKRQQVDTRSDYSGGFKTSDGTEDQIRDKRQTSSDSKNLLDDQLRQMKSDILKLDCDKQQLEIFLEKKVQEADSLNLGIQELEMQLSKEKEECKRITSKMKKFIKAHGRHLRLQEELKRSQAQLKKLGEQLGSDAAGPIANEDDININTMSDDETADELLKDASPRKKRTRVHLEPRDISNEENPTRGDKLAKLSRRHVHHLQSSYSKEPEAYGDANNGHKQSALVEKERNTPDTALPDKFKVSESGLPLPPTGMAAHAVDEDVEVVETEEKAHVVAAASAGAGPEVAPKIPRLPFLPPPPPPPPPLIPQNVYIQYKGDDENVDIDGPDEEMVEVDIV